jgi:hypothetical protein
MNKSHYQEVTNDDRINMMMMLFPKQSSLSSQLITFSGGTRVVKLNDGLKEEIPNLTHQKNVKQMFSQYKAYCKEKEKAIIQ